MASNNNSNNKQTTSTTLRKPRVKIEPVSKCDFRELLMYQHEGWGRPAVELSVLESRQVAKDAAPTLLNLLWNALNGPEPETGNNHLRDLLCVHNAIPSLYFGKKLMHLMKFGPKDNGKKVYFYDCHRIEIASRYVYGLVEASTRLVRADSSALFGPSSWEDIAVLLGQSIAQTNNVVSGRRLAEALHLSAKGAKLLSLMLKTELQGVNLFDASSVRFSSDILASMPTISCIKLMACARP